MTKQEKQVEDWNGQHPEGTRVTFYKLRNPLRAPFQTETRSEAWLMGGHSAMVMVDGVGGGVSLDNIELRE